MNGKNQIETQQTFLFTQQTNLYTWLETFLVDRRAMNLTKGTIENYREKLLVFLKWCDARAISDVTQITTNNLRQFLLYLEEQGHNPGGVHGFYRAVKTFLRFYESEADDDWKNPIKKVKAPRVPLEPLEPVTFETVTKLIETCDKSSLIGIRDISILYSLLDTGCRATEFININVADANLFSGEILIRQGKGRKPRFVYLGRKSRKAVRAYLKRRKDKNPALFVTKSYDRFTYDGLRSLVTRRSQIAGIKPPNLHSFRRATAINLLRAGVDIFTIQNLLGHANLAVLQRYLKVTEVDVKMAIEMNSPVDGAF